MINRDDLTASRLPIYDTDYTRLTLAIQDAPVATPNPQRDPTGVAELIQRERISLPIQNVIDVEETEHRSGATHLPQEILCV